VREDEERGRPLSLGRRGGRGGGGCTGFKKDHLFPKEGKGFKNFSSSAGIYVRLRWKGRHRGNIQEIEVLGPGRIKKNIGKARGIKQALVSQSRRETSRGRRSNFNLADRVFGGK